MRACFLQRGVPAALAIGLSASLPATAAAQITFVPDTSRVIHATGRASIAIQPDLATVTLGVWVADADARRAKASVDSIVGKIVALARTLKVAETDLQTAAVNIEPRYDPENPTRLRGYEVTRSVTVVLKQIDALDSLLDGAVQSGANRDFDVDLSSSRLEALKRDAIAQALADARTQADTAADKMGVRIVGVRSIDLNGSSRPGVIQTMATTVGYVTGQAPARFLPGVIRITADVPVVFLIEDRR